MSEIPAQLRKQGIKGLTTNVGEDQYVKVNAGMVMAFFGDELIRKLQERQRCNKAPSTSKK